MSGPGHRRGSTPDYERAFREAKRLLTPGSVRGGFKGDTDEWRLARAQWHYDFGSKALAERELKDINMFRMARRDRYPDIQPMEFRRDR